MYVRQPRKRARLDSKGLSSFNPAIASLDCGVVLQIWQSIHSVHMAQKNTILWMVFFVDIGVSQRSRGSTTASLGCDFVFTNWECDPSCLSAYEMPSIRMAFQRVEKVFSPRCLSSFLNFSSSENCLIERERGFLPLSLYPRCSVAVLHFIVLTNPEKRPPQSLRRALF